MYTLLRPLAWFVAMAIGLAHCTESPAGGDTDPAGPAAEAVDLSAEQAQLAGIEWGQPDQRMLADDLECAGTVEVPPYSLGSVYAPVSGWVREVRHLPGQYVRKGERLTVLEHPEIIRRQREILTSASQLEALEKDFHRKKVLAGTEAASQRDLEQARTAYEQEKALYESLRAELSIMGFSVDELLERGQIESSLVLRSPVAGYLHEVNINMGKLVRPEELLFEIVDTRHIHLELQIYAKDLSRITKGLRIEASMPGSDSTYQAEVYLIGRMVDPETKTALIHAHFIKEPVPITPGTYMHAHVFFEERQVTALPEEAVVREGDHTYVFIRRGNSVARQQVRIGQRAEGYVEVLDLALEPTEEVALRGAYYLNGQWGEEG